MEIEKKFKIKYLPEGYEQCKKKEIEQGYLCFKPTVRIRKSNENYILTYKTKKKNPILNDDTICNEEIEVDLSEEAYLHLLKKIDGRAVIKTRYIIPIENDLKVELDVFHGHLEGLVFAEVEFPDVMTAADFKKPEWFGDEVSADRRYRNTYLSLISSIEEFIE